MAWIPIPGTKYFSEDGKGVYEKLSAKTFDGLYLRISLLDESEEFDFYRSQDNVTAFRYPSKPNREK
jgi:hypothetical protein